MAREVGSGLMRPPTEGLRQGDELHDVFEIFEIYAPSGRHMDFVLDE